MDTIYHDKDLTQHSPYGFDVLISSSDNHCNQTQLTVKVNDDAEDDFAAFFLAVRKHDNGDASITSRQRMWFGIEYKDPSEVALDYPCYFALIEQNSCAEEKFF